MAYQVPSLENVELQQSYPCCVSVIIMTLNLLWLAAKAVAMNLTRMS